MEEFLRDYALEAQPSKGYIFGSNPSVREKLRKRLRMLGQNISAIPSSGRLFNTMNHYQIWKSMNKHSV